MTGKGPVLVGDTAGMTQEEFAASRTGLGGSDQAVLKGISPWGTLYGLWCRCRGLAKTEFKTEDDWRLAAGHILEPLVAEAFRRKTGFRVIDDTGIYAHADHPFMRANLDRLYERPVQDGDGNVSTIRGVLELKTTFPENTAVTEYWRKGVCPPYYECQVRFYMAVMDIDEAYIACMWGFDDKRDYACVRIGRDMAEEADILQRNVRFWEDYVLTGRKPPLGFAAKPANVVRDIRAYSGFADPSLPCAVFDTAYAADAEEIEEIDGAIRDLKEEVKILEEMRERAQAVFVDALGKATAGVIPLSDDAYYDISYKPQSRATVPVERLMAEAPELVAGYTKVSTGALKADHPEVFQKVAQTGGEDSRVFRIKRKKHTRKTREALDKRMEALRAQGGAAT